MSIAVEPEAIVAPSVHALTLWGRTATELHDVYWRTMGVSVVRPGSAAPEAAGMYLLCGRGTTAVLDFRRVLDVMGWMVPALCVVRAKAMPLPAGQTSATSGAPVRCGFTPGAAIADDWRKGDGSFGAWGAIKERVGAERVCVARPTGRVVDHASPQVVLERLATVWGDPTLGIDGLKKVARGIYALERQSIGTGHVRGARKVWLGKGRRLDEVRAGGRVCVLRDAEA